MNVSVVVPSFNSEKEIEGCLATLAPQLKSGDEVIIIDGGSRDRTLDIASGYGCQIHIYPEASLGRCRDFGAQIAKNDVILQTDTDILFPQGFIERLRGDYENPEVVGVSGGWVDGENRLLGNMVCAVFEGVLQYADCLLSYRKEAYNAINGHPNVSFGEQIGTWLQLKKFGPTIYDPDLYVYHFSERLVNIPSYLIGGTILGAGAVYEAATGADLGYALMGHGAGWILGQAGVDLGINKDAPPNHFHHWQLGLMLVASAMAFSEVMPGELEAALYGLGSGLAMHDFLTEAF